MRENKDKQNKWEDVQKMITTTAKEVLGIQKHHQNNRIHDTDIERLSEKQKKLRIEISNTVDIEKVTELKRERNRILHLSRKHLT